MSCDILGEVYGPTEDYRSAVRAVEVREGREQCGRQDGHVGHAVLYASSEDLRRVAGYS